MTTTGFNILLVEDEENIRHTIQLNLELDGYQVVGADNGLKALESFRKAKFDLVILDVMLPEMSGFDVCDNIRKIDQDIPILFLTAKNTSSDRIQGLKIGADDYLTKPFNLEELLLRVQKLLKRRNTSKIPKAISSVYSFGGNQVNFITYEISNHRNEKHTLSHREIQLLKLLTDRKDQVVSRDEILEKIWGEDTNVTSRTIDNYILAFRKYFEPNPKESCYFHSIRGVGYKFTNP